MMDGGRGLLVLGMRSFAAAEKGTGYVLRGLGTHVN